MEQISFKTIDWIVLTCYIALIVSVGLIVSREKKGKQKNSSDYFLASKSLPFWAVGASLIASNISAEHFMGMSGSAYKIGLGIAIYEWIGALGLIVLGKFFLPIYHKKQIYTMPQFLEKRFDKRVKTSLAVFWIGLYIFVNLTSVLFLGALGMQTILGIPLIYGIIALAFFSAVYSLYGGLKAVAWTDVIQVIFLIFGGLVTTIMAMRAFNGENASEGFFTGLKTLFEQVPDKFDLILSKDHPYYKDLPGISVLVGAMWIINLNYFGFNQYITQRALAAKSLKEAQRGTVFAAYLKFLIPFLVVIPGIIAFVMTNNTLQDPDNAYPWLLHKFVPAGFKGLTFAALIAAIVSSLSSMVNSTSTIFTLDIYKPHINKDASEKSMVLVGRIVSFIALLMATCIAPMLKNIEQVFQYIQEFTGWVSPGIVVIFLSGLFFKRATANAALLVAIITIPLAVAFKFFIAPDMPWLDRMGVIFLILTSIMVIYSLVTTSKNHPFAIQLNKGLFKTGWVFNVGAIGVIIVMIILYYFLW